jgi:hypothetical protein
MSTSKKSGWISAAKRRKFLVLRKLCYNIMGVTISLVRELFLTGRRKRTSSPFTRASMRQRIKSGIPGRKGRRAQ